MGAAAALAAAEAGRDIEDSDSVYGHTLPTKKERSERKKKTRTAADIENDNMDALVDGVNIETDSFYINGEEGTAGWRDGALQAGVGYYDVYDDNMHLLGFDIDGTKLSLPRGVDLRLWKGDYDSVGNLPIGGGGEIGFYKNNSSMTPTQLSEELGLLSTKLEIIERGTDRPVAERSEVSPRFWTTVFKSSDNPRKENIYSKTTYNFSSKENADNFLKSARFASKEAKKYRHNRNQGFGFSQNAENNSISITWGK